MKGESNRKLYYLYTRWKRNMLEGSNNEGRVVDIDMTNQIVNYANVMTYWNNGVDEEKFSIAFHDPTSLTFQFYN